VPAKGSWFSFAAAPTHTQHAEVATAAAVPQKTSDTGLVATIRNVFIPTPDPNLAPKHPDDPPESSAASTASSQERKKHHRLTLHKHSNEDKLVDYINTLEISRSDLESSKEAVVVLHGYAAALG